MPWNGPNGEIDEGCIWVWYNLPKGLLLKSQKSSASRKSSLQNSPAPPIFFWWGWYPAWGKSIVTLIIILILQKYIGRSNQIQLYSSIQGIDCMFLSCPVTLGDCNWTQTHNHLVHKWTLNDLAKLAKWLSCAVSTYLYGAFDRWVVVHSSPVAVT